MIARLQQALRRTAFGVAGGLFMILGAAFLTAAAWMALALAHGGVVASVIIGLLMCGIGLVCLAMAARKPAPPPIAPSAPRQGDLLAAFLKGIETGKAMRR